MRFTGAWKSVNTDGIDVLHDAAPKHEFEPVRVKSIESGEHCALAASLRPISGAADHGAEGLPVRVEGAIPLAQPIRLIPEFDPFKTVSQASDQNVDKIAVGLGIPGWRR